MGNAITNYGWSDGKKKVDIYVELPDIDAVKDEDLVVENEETSVKLTIKAIGSPPKCRVLSISNLNADITEVKLARKPGKVVLKLMKKEVTSWYSLTQGGDGGGGGDGDDDGGMGGMDMASMMAGMGGGMGM